jgi:outer membrane protein OmpA-like peptidoglycan-associated protein
MKTLLATTCILAGTLLAGGCATKKYVRNTSAPIQAKVDQVGEQTNQNSTQITETRDQVKQVDERAQSGISAAQEKAATADQHAGDAMNKANAADQHAGLVEQKADQSTQAIASLRNVVANIDDYKLQTSATVPFKFNASALSDDAKQDLDKLAGDVKTDKRFFIAVEGYTDSVGNRQYNDVLSKKRADNVVNYLVTKHDIPIYRIQMVGLGQERPVDEAHNRTARAKNRRVEVKVFSADQATASLAGDANRAIQQPEK